MEKSGTSSPQHQTKNTGADGGSVKTMRKNKTHSGGDAALARLSLPLLTALAQTRYGHIFLARLAGCETCEREATLLASLVSTPAEAVEQAETIRARCVTHGKKE